MDSMSKETEQPKRPRGRPVKYPLPEPIADTPENIMRAVLAAPPKGENNWDYIQRTGRKSKRR